MFGTLRKRFAARGGAAPVAPPVAPAPPSAIDTAALGEELKAISAARAAMHAERVKLKALGLTHPDEAQGAILAGAEATNYVQIGRNHFGQPMIHTEPLDSPIIVTRNTTGSPQGRYYLANAIAAMTESSDIWSCQGTYFGEMRGTDNPLANVNGLTAMDSMFYGIIHGYGGAVFGYHLDAWLHGKGNLVGANVEVKRTSPDGTAIAFNAQSDVDSAPYPGDIPYYANGPWKRGFTRSDHGEIFGVGGTPYGWTRDSDGAFFLGPNGNITLDRQGNVYAGPEIRPGVRGFMVVDGVMYLNGKKF